MTKIPESEVVKKITDFLDNSEIRYKTEIGANGGRVDIALLDYPIAFECKALGSSVYHTLEKQIERYRKVFKEVWIIVANDRAKSHIYFEGADKLITVDEFPAHIPYLKEKIEGY